MDETISIDLEKWETVDFFPISESLLETLNAFSKLYEEVMKPLTEMVKPILKAIQDIVRKIFNSIGSIDFRYLPNQFYFTDFATIDVSNAETRRNQLPKKIIEDDSDSTLSISYSAIYSDYKFNDRNNEMIESEIHKKVSDDKDAPLSNQPLLSTENLVITIIGAVATALFLLVDKEQLGMSQAFFLFFSFLTIFSNKD